MMTPAERFTAAALDTLDVAIRANLALDAVEEEIRMSAARVIWRREEMKRERLRVTAIHEFTHAVGCEVYGIPYAVVHLGIEDASRQPSTGRVVLDGPPPDEPRAIEHYIVMLLAAGAAERRAGNAFPQDSDDRARADVLSLGMGFSSERTRESFIRHCVNQADDLVVTHWRWIKAGAEQLLERGSLTAFQVRALRPTPDEVLAA